MNTFRPERNHAAGRDEVAGSPYGVASYVLMYARDQEDAAPEAVFDAAVAALRLLGDDTRLRLLWHLRDDERDVTALTAALGTAARPAVSQHLAKLRLAGLVTTRRDGRRVLYRLNGTHVRRLVLESLAQARHLRTASPSGG